jgi:hypothetical protein
MAIYIVIEINGYDIPDSIVAVFDSEELAKQYINKKSYLSYKILEFKLNEE